MDLQMEVEMDAIVVEYLKRSNNRELLLRPNSEDVTASCVSHK